MPIAPITDWGAALRTSLTSALALLITLIVAFDALGLPAVSQVLQQFLLWIPNLVVALIARKKDTPTLEVSYYGLLSSGF